MSQTITSAFVPASLAPVVQALIDSPQAFFDKTDRGPADWALDEIRFTGLRSAMSIYAEGIPTVLSLHPAVVSAMKESVNKSTGDQYSVVRYPNNLAVLARDLPSGLHAMGARALERSLRTNKAGELLLQKPKKNKYKKTVSTESDVRKLTNFFRSEEEALEAVTPDEFPQYSEDEDIRGRLVGSLGLKDSKDLIGDLFRLWKNESKKLEDRKLALVLWIDSIDDTKDSELHALRASESIYRTWLNETDEGLSKVEEEVLGLLLVYYTSYTNVIDFVTIINNSLSSVVDKPCDKKLKKIYEFYAAVISRYLQGRQNTDQSNFPKTLVDSALFMLDRTLDSTLSVTDRSYAFDIAFFGIERFLPEIGGQMMYDWLMWQATRIDNPELAYKFVRSYAKPYTAYSNRLAGKWSPFPQQQDVIFKVLERKDLTDKQRKDLWELSAMDMFANGYFKDLFRAWLARHFGPAADKNFAR